MRSPVAELLAALAAALDRLGVRWYLFGAQAALLYGSARLTADVDVTVDIGDMEPAKLVTALAAAGFRMRVDVEHREDSGPLHEVGALTQKRRPGSPSSRAPPRARSRPPRS